MAMIQYTISRDPATDQAIVTYAVRSIGPGDVITFVTSTPGTAVQVTGDSPFQAPSSDGDVLSVPVTANPQPLTVVKSVDASNVIQWLCGDTSTGHFTAWLGDGPNFPPIKPPKGT